MIASSPLRSAREYDGVHTANAGLSVPHALAPRASPVPLRITAGREPAPPVNNPRTGNVASMFSAADRTGTASLK